MRSDHRHALYDEELWQESVPAPGYSIYSAGPRPELPGWLRERRLVSRYSNGIGLAILAFLLISRFLPTLLAVLLTMVTPHFYLRGAQFYAPEYIGELMNAVTYAAALLLPFGIFALCIRIPGRVAVPFRRVPPGFLWGFVLMGMGLSVVGGAASSLLRTALGFLGAAPVYPEVPLPQTWLARVVYFVLTTLLAAFVEEVVFRGMLMQSLRRFNDIFALLLSSAIFAACHLNLLQAPFAFLMGLGLGYFTLRCGSLWPAVLLHFLNNAVALGMDLLQSVLNPSLFGGIYNFVNALWLLMGAFAFVILLRRDPRLFTVDNRASALPFAHKLAAFVSAPLFLAAVFFLTIGIMRTL